MLTDLSFIERGKQWPPDAESERLTLYAKNRNLFEGKHELVYRDAWNRLLREEQSLVVQTVLNWPKRLSTLWADLLLGEPPKITAGESESEEQQACDRIINDNDLHNAAYEAVLDVSSLGTGLFKVRYDGRGIIECQPPELWFPVVDPVNIRNIIAHVIAWTTVPANSHKPGQFIAEIHERGKITRVVHEYASGRIGRMVEEPVETLTGIDDFLVVPCHNLRTSNRLVGLDDYTDLDTVISELEVRIGQIARILDKHSDPNMYGPASALEEDPGTGEHVFRGGGKYFSVAEGESPPGYATWDGQLDAAFHQIDLLMEQLYALSETSAAAFGNLKEGLAESGSALKRLLMAPLAKVNRIRMRFDPALKQAIRLCAALEVAQGMPNAVELPNITIAWRDGLPDDEVEQARIMVERKGAGLISTESAIKHLDGLEGEQLEAELDKIAGEQMQARPMPGMTDLGGLFEGLDLGVTPTEGE